MDSHRFGRMIRLLDNAYKQALTQSMSELGLTAAQSHCLTFIHHREKRGIPVHSKDIASFFNISHPTVSGILRRLEANGFIVFSSEDDDRRSKRINLTPKAYDDHARAMASFMELESRMLSGFSNEEIEIFAELLGKAADNIGVCRLPDFMKGDER